MHDHDPFRRRFLSRSGTALSLGALSASLPLLPAIAGPAPITAESARPQLPYGLQFGDVGERGATVWARSDRAARLWVEIGDEDGFRRALRLRGPLASEASDFTSRLDIPRLPGPCQRKIRVAFEDARSGVRSAWSEGRLRAAPHTLPHARTRPVRFVWGGDVAGQGWGINPEIGGMRIFEAMRLRDPDFFLHSGDTIYADGAIAAEAPAENGRIWRNLVAEGVHKVAETLDEYRGRYRYNLLDENLRRFAAQVPQLWQWDDHEVVNNWSPSKDLRADPRYTVKDIDVLVRRARQAFLEYSPQRRGPDPRGTRIDRVIHYGPLLDVFMLDMRSYRGPNTDNLQAAAGADTAFLGRRQLRELAEGLRRSRATWKIVAADMPLGLQVPDGTDAQGRPRWEAVANGDPGLPRGRELEFAELLRAIRGVDNVVWLTADVHYCAAHHYDPSRAAFQDFSPFWEFVAGPLNAGSFGPNALDASFGPKVVFQKAPPAPNASPLAGYQFFGEVNIDPDSRALSVDLRDLDGASVFTQVLQAV
ncbi:alkaline phosphatase D family protein [Lysobacter gummosus]|uniref:Alkaline phosphatase D family protein n=1 Tax=Lysobacter gummosus TaxID=262324 RepID=A0ABY3XJG3_9GAMM|nr:alkaline phosphatase D family protein [Lysobacter gummosus]ALN91406.1 phoD-like phosphatase family protein [Lysobacter gummosus]UNP31782.1 alkaline phosphatase D family protein [Lysobacter gummosus]